jgi:hypothetical protein
VLLVLLTVAATLAERLDGSAKIFTAYYEK